MAEPVRARRLSDEEGRRLLQIVRRGKHGSVRVRRAIIIMASASGTLVPAIARLVAADEDTVRDVISGNVARAEGPTGAAQGGGIWNGLDVITGALPPVQLTLVNTSVTRNVLEGSAGISLQGAGLFTTSPMTLTNTQIALNRPDQCVGCQGMQAAAAGNRAHDDRGHRNLSTLLRQLDK
jgi:hypothetical protein